MENTVSKYILMFSSKSEITKRITVFKHPDKTKNRTGKEKKNKEKKYVLETLRSARSFQSNYSRLAGAKAYREKRCNPDPNHFRNHRLSCRVPLHVRSSAQPSLPSSVASSGSCRQRRADGRHGGGHTRVGAAGSAEPGATVRRADA
jgi:hypothetical protein